MKEIQLNVRVYGLPDETTASALAYLVAKFLAHHLKRFYSPDVGAEVSGPEVRFGKPEKAPSKSLLRAFEAGNKFEVRLESNGEILFTPWTNYTMRYCLSEALNLAVWLALITDPEGEDFLHLYRRIARR